MKTFSSLTFLAAAAVFFAEARLEVFVSAVCVLGLGAILALDYGHARPALKLPTASRPRRPSRAVFVPPPLNGECNRLAA